VLEEDKQRLAEYAALLARHTALAEECDNLKDHNQYLEACLEDRNAEMMRHVRMYETLVEEVAKMRHANNKDRWNAFEWADACAEVDRLMGEVNA
jgi:dihydroneopterin aldolase